MNIIFDFEPIQIIRLTSLLDVLIELLLGILQVMGFFETDVAEYL